MVENCQGRGSQRRQFPGDVDRIAAFPMMSQALDNEQVLVRFQGKAGPPKSPDLFQSVKHSDDLDTRFNLGFVAYLYNPRTPKTKRF